MERATAGHHAQFGSDLPAHWTLDAGVWISSHTKRFLFTRFLANSGLDRALQYAIAQIVANIVLIVGIFIVLENTGIHLGALTVFAGAVGVGVGFGLQNIASNSLAASSFWRSDPSPSATASKSPVSPARSNKFGRAAPSFGQMTTSP